MPTTYAGLTIEDSEAIEARNLKIMVYGPTASHKTEDVLRNFPAVLGVDAEGNMHLCAKKKEIAPFLRVATKDTNKVVELVDGVAAGKLKMQDNKPVQTLLVDSVTVLYEARKEFGAMVAEARQMRYKKPADEADISMGDWGKIKRPLKELMVHANNSGIKYLVFIARETGKTEKRPGASREDDRITVGVTWDVMKGMDYDMNLILHNFYLENEDGGKVWQTEVMKSQGILSEHFPVGKRFAKFPFDLIAKVAEGLKPAPGTEKSEAAAAVEEIKSEEAEAAKLKAAATDTEKRKSEFIAEAFKMGYAKDGKPDVKSISAVLAPLNMTPYSVANHDAALAALKAVLVPAE